jgi:hypothetical protein
MYSRYRAGGNQLFGQLEKNVKIDRGVVSLASLVHAVKTVLLALLSYSEGQCDKKIFKNGV